MRPGAIAAGLAVVVLPYAVYAASHAPDFAGQALVQESRVRFWSPTFYLANLAREPERYAHLARRAPWSPAGLGGWTLLLVALPLTLRDAALARARAARRDLSGIAALAVLLTLAVVEQRKGPVYASLVLPSFCLALATAVTTGLEWVRERRAAAVRRAGGLALAAGCGLLAREGLEGFRFVLREGPRATRYLDLGRRLRAALPRATVVAGSERWWWAVQPMRYRSLNGIWIRWRLAVARGEAADFAALADGMGLEALVLSRDTRADLARADVALQRQFFTFRAERCRPVTAWNDPTYGSIEVEACRKP